ncbi:MAG: GGDEF domain-containing protein [Bacillota bacterium]
MARGKNKESLVNIFYFVLILLGLIIINLFFHVFSGLVIFFIIAASSLSLYLNTLQAKFRKRNAGQFFAFISAIYNPLMLAALIILTDYRTMIWLLLFIAVMLRNPYLGFVPSVINGIVSVLCFIFLGIKIYGLQTFEIVFGSLVFFTASVLAWVLTLKLWLFEQQSMRDGLTGLRNRRSFNATLRQEIKQCLQNDRPISLMMIDIDNFKKYNDTMGHVKGDEILKKMAGIMTMNVRDRDLIFRYGGEEFCVLLPGVGMSRAKKIAERVREQVEKAFTSHDFPLTVSIGVSSSEGNSRDAKYLLDFADKAMYRAKILKNRVIVAESEAN